MFETLKGIVLIIKVIYMKNTFNLGSCENVTLQFIS